MKSSNKAKPDIKEKEIEKEQKASGCCGPTCCGGSVNQKEESGKEK